MEKWTIIDRKTQIVSLIILIVGIIVVSSVFISLFIFPLFEEKREITGGAFTIDYEPRFFGTWVNTSTNGSNEYPFSWYTFYPNGTCITPDGEYRWLLRVIYDKTYDETPDDGIKRLCLLNNSLLYYNPVYYFSNNNSTLHLIHSTAEGVTKLVYDKQ